jgi:hypothetical protein
MDKNNGRPILVTGAHRSGTTWVGKVLSASPSVGYIDEPFSPVVRHYSPGTCNAEFDYWWMYVTEENESPHYDHIAAMLGFRYQLRAQLKRIIKNRCGVRTFLKGYGGFLANRYIHHARPLLKDPIALFSTEWLARRFNMDVVILIRHPAAFVSSIKRMNWPHDFRNFLDQPLLMRDHLAPLEEEIREYIKGDHDIIEDAILLWRMFYYVVNKFRDNHKEFIFLRHEDISRRPVEKFRKLFDGLNIELTDKIRSVIIRHSEASNPSEAPEGIPHQLNRNSLANIKNWKNRLSESEIERIREGVEDISSLFYKDEDWE